jgi:hypothetical protein
MAHQQDTTESTNLIWLAQRDNAIIVICTAAATLTLTFAA